MQGALKLVLIVSEERYGVHITCMCLHAWTLTTLSGDCLFTFAEIYVQVSFPAKMKKFLVSE